MKESYRSWVNSMFRSMTPEQSGRICAVYALSALQAPYSSMWFQQPTSFLMSNT
jgi:hypothetical protein